MSQRDRAKTNGALALPDGCFRLALLCPLAMRPHIVELDQVNLLASTVFGDFEQVQDAKESRLARQFRGNVWKPYRFNRVDLDLPFLHTVPRAYSDARTRPDAHAASDFSAAHSLAKSLGECHGNSLRKNVEAAKRQTRRSLHAHSIVQNGTIKRQYCEPSP